MKIVIKGTKLELTQPIKDYVNEKIGSLEKFFGKIIEARVEVEMTTRHHQKGDIYRAEVNLRIPGKIIRVEKTEKNLYKAIDKVKDHLIEQLSEYKERQRDKRFRELRKKR